MKDLKKICVGTCGTSQTPYGIWAYKGGVVDGPEKGFLATSTPTLKGVGPCGREWGLGAFGYSAKALYKRGFTGVGTPYPAPEEEQQEVEAILSEFDEQIKKIRRRVEDRLRKGHFLEILEVAELLKI